MEGAGGSILTAVFLPMGLTLGPTTCDTNTEPIFTCFDCPESTAPSGPQTHHGNQMGMDLTPKLHQTQGLVKGLVFFLYSSQIILSGAKLSQKDPEPVNHFQKMLDTDLRSADVTGCLIAYTLQPYAMLC